MPTDRKGVETIIRTAFDKALHEQANARYPVVMKTGWIETPLGALLAVGNDEHLYMLSFVELAGMERRAAVICKTLKANLVTGDSAAIESVRLELKAYFAGRLRVFATPIRPMGSSFQLAVWKELAAVPYGNAVTYADLANRLGKPTAFRAAALAVAQSPIHIIIPCHRVVNAGGGAAAANERRQWLLDFEKNNLITKGV